MRRFYAICLAAAVTVIVGSLALAAPTPRYVFTDLGSIPNSGMSEAAAINDRGQVVINAGTGGAAREFCDGSPRYGQAFVWTPNKPNGTTGKFWDMGVILPWLMQPPRPYRERQERIRNPDGSA